MAELVDVWASGAHGIISYYVGSNPTIRIYIYIRGYSSVGRALALQARSRRFDSGYLQNISER
jgi:hypothetical protein